MQAASELYAQFFARPCTRTPAEFQHRRSVRQCKLRAYAMFEELPRASSYAHENTAMARSFCNAVEGRKTQAGNPVSARAGYNYIANTHNWKGNTMQHYRYRYGPHDEVYRPGYGASDPYRHDHSPRDCERFALRQASGAPVADDSACPYEGVFAFQAGRSAGAFNQEGGRVHHSQYGGGHHPDRDYAQWRNEQVRRFDDDYAAWRKERYHRFAGEFNEWRRKRASARERGKQVQEGNGGETTESGDAKSY